MNLKTSSKNTQQDTADSAADKAVATDDGCIDKLLLPKDKLTNALRGEERLYFKETMQDGKRHRELISKKLIFYVIWHAKSIYLKKKHRTSRGLKVRSKSELLIAERLYANNVPFRYEQLLHVGTKVYAPDFTIKRNDGNIVYWEHCGLPNDKSYMNRHKKIEDYESAGIVPWRNLIVTYEDEDYFNIEIIDSEIKNKLLIKS